MDYYFTQAMVFTGLIFGAVNLNTGTENIINSSGCIRPYENKRNKKDKKNDYVKKVTASIISEKLYCIIGFMFSAIGVFIQSTCNIVESDICVQRIGFLVCSCIFLGVGFVVKWFMKKIVQKRVYGDIDNGRVKI